MRKIILGAVLVLILVFAFRYFENRKSEEERLEANTELIQEQIKNVGKLIVTEGSFSQVYSYKIPRNFISMFFQPGRRLLSL